METDGREADARREAVWNALRTVIDPEIGLDIVTLGLVYDVVIDDDGVGITHTLTTPGCPMEKLITAGIRNAVDAVSGAGRVAITLAWDPVWHPGMIAPGAW